MNIYSHFAVYLLGHPCPTARRPFPTRLISTRPNNTAYHFLLLLLEIRFSEALFSSLQFDIEFNNSEHAYFAGQEISGRERVLPEGRHEVPFSYTLPKTLPSSFEGDYGYIRYTCRAICERPWDFDIVTKKAFTVIGIEDINEDPKVRLGAGAMKV
uniref:Arrestin_N domain-containing protein n=1 Tax=Steinernema glaseri TaxID=37863 RepID=A0A1I8ANM9_9BILA